VLRPDLQTVNEHGRLNAAARRGKRHETRTVRVSTGAVAQAPRRRRASRSAFRRALRMSFWSRSETARAAVLQPGSTSTACGWCQPSPVGGSPSPSCPPRPSTSLSTACFAHSSQISSRRSMSCPRRMNEIPTRATSTPRGRSVGSRRAKSIVASWSFEARLCPVRPNAGQILRRGDDVHRLWLGLVG
jgi:hypothetical protein